MKIGFISDIHEDICSLEKALILLKKKKIDTIYCLGDITGFSLPYYSYKETRNAGKCIDLVQKNSELSILGNHDLFTIKKIPKFTSGFIYPDDWYQTTEDNKKKLSGNKLWLYDHSDLSSELDQNQYNYLDNLCEFEVVSQDNQSFFLSHFIYPDLSGSTTKFPKRKSFFSKHFDFMEKNNCQLGFCGHGHYNGAGLCTKKSFSVLKPGVYTLDHTPSIIIVPCIAESKSMSGITIFNTETYELEIISINDQ